MPVRLRLRLKFEARKAQRTCTRCTHALPPHSSPSEPTLSDSRCAVPLDDFQILALENLKRIRQRNARIRSGEKETKDNTPKNGVEVGNDAHVIDLTPSILQSGLHNSALEAQRSQSPDVLEHERPLKSTRIDVSKDVEDRDRGKSNFEQRSERRGEFLAPDASAEKEPREPTGVASQRPVDGGFSRSATSIFQGPAIQSRPADQDEKSPRESRSRSFSTSILRHPRRRRVMRWPRNPQVTGTISTSAPSGSHTKKHFTSNSVDHLSLRGHETGSRIPDDESKLSCLLEIPLAGRDVELTASNRLDLRVQQGVQLIDTNVGHDCTDFDVFGSRPLNQGSLRVDDSTNEELDGVLDAARYPNLIQRASYTTYPKIPALHSVRLQRSRACSLARVLKLYYRDKTYAATIGKPRLMSTTPFVSPPASTTGTEIPPIYDFHASFVQRKAALAPVVESTSIRQHLQLWQEQYDQTSAVDIPNLPKSVQRRSGSNVLTQSGESGAQVILDPEEEEDESSLYFDSTTRTPEILDGPRFLNQGDLVELFGVDESHLGIYIRTIGYQAQFYTYRGYYVHKVEKTIRFVVPSFVEPKDLEEILPFLPATEAAVVALGKLQSFGSHVPRDVGAKVVKKMRQFHLASDSVFREHADRLNRVHEIMSPKGSSSMRRSASIEEVAMKVLQKDRSSEIAPSALWAVHRALTRSQDVLHNWQTHRTHPVFDFLPKQGLTGLGKVRQWIRDFQEESIDGMTGAVISNPVPGMGSLPVNPIRGFVKKARAAIERSRQTRPLSPSGGIAPSSVKVDPIEPNLAVWRTRLFEPLTPDEKIIVDYLDAWVASRYLNTPSNLKSLGPLILRAVGMYDGLDLSVLTGFLLLQELGLIAPWQNRRVYLAYSGLPGFNSSDPATKLHRDAQLSLSTFDAKDSMRNFRKDWGEMPVFCVDAFTTTDIDDGFSLQFVDEDPSLAWIHVHVANPSAFISHESALARYAAALSQSVYLPEFKYPMLEPKLVNEIFSLGNDRPCITFSAKVNVNGEILEKNITNGIVRKVYNVRPQKIAEVLGYGEADKADCVTLLRVGGALPEGARRKTNKEQSEAEPAFTPHDVRVLQTLGTFSDALRLRRTRNGAITYKRQWGKETSSEVYLSREHVDSAPMAQRIRRFDGDPIISIEQSTETANYGYQMVEDLMILAGEISALWCKERNIPIPYRGIVRKPDPEILPEDYKRDVLDPELERNGVLWSDYTVKYMQLVGSSAISASPLEHIVLGLSAYCHTTSPIRRYVDLCAHWQIEAALRHEKQTGTPLDGTDGNSYLPFSRFEVEAVAREALGREKRLLAMKRASQRHWITQALFRAYYFNEAPLPDVFPVVIRVMVDFKHTQTAQSSTGWVDAFGRDVYVPATPLVMQEGGFEVGDTWECKIASIVPYFSDITVEPVRKLSSQSKAGELPP